MMAAIVAPFGFAAWRRRRDLMPARNGRLRRVVVTLRGVGRKRRPVPKRGSMCEAAAAQARH
jgi:hypothetical protein